MIIYHGSPNIIEYPEYGKGKEYNDYGKGFYCTEYEELAMEWACTEGMDGYANKYEIDMSKLNVLYLDSKEYTILNWLAILVTYRGMRMSSPMMEKGAAWLKEHFLVDFSGYDVVVGYRADDSYFSFARAFLGNEISLEQLRYAMKLGKFGQQVVIKSEKAFGHIHFLSYKVADNLQYYTMRKSRDDNARKEYYKELERDDMNGVYMRDIIREGMKNDDARLR